MQTKYNLGDTVWNYVFYDGINVKLRKCEIVEIKNTINAGLVYGVESDSFYGTAHFSEDELFSDKCRALRASRGACEARVQVLKGYIKDIDKELEKC